MPPAGLIFGTHKKRFPMKKFCLSLVFAIGSVMTFANNLTIMSFSPCSYFIQLDEGGGQIYAPAFYSGSFANPSLVPGSTAASTATFIGAGIRRDDFPDGFGVGTAPLGQPHRSSTEINDYPACNSGLSYDVYWNANPNTGDIVLLIL